MSGPAGTIFGDNVINPAIAVDTPFLQPTVLSLPWQVAGTTLTGPITGVSRSVFSTQLESQPQLWRKTASSLTAYLTASAIADQGTVYATQIGRSYTPGGLNVGAATHPGPSPANILYREYLGALPFDQDALAAVDPKLYVAPAR
jgi:hypothetical protein